MTSSQQTGHRSDAGAAGVQGQPTHTPRRRSTETKASFKTTEFIVYIVAVIGVLIVSAVVGDTKGGRPDYFLADKAWLYIVILTVGYMIARGLAKSGSHENYDGS